MFLIVHYALDLTLARFDAKKWCGDVEEHGLFTPGGMVFNSTLIFVQSAIRRFLLLRMHSYQQVHSVLPESDPSAPWTRTRLDSRSCRAAASSMRGYLDQPVTLAVELLPHRRVQ